jgi:hypothetical protein
MNLLPPVGWADVATKRDLDALEGRLETKIDAVRQATRGDLYEVRSDLQRTFVTWLLISQATVVAAVGLLIAAFS